MAITKTTTVQRIEVYPAMNPDAEATENAAHESVMVVYLDSFDDSDDDTLPITSSRAVNLQKFDGEGVATVLTGEDQLVQDICGAIWA